MSAIYANPSNQIAALKELYKDDSFWMKDLVYKNNPFFALLAKDESPDGMAGKYMPCPIINATAAGRAAQFAYAQSNQAPAVVNSFFVYRVSNYGIATITNELLEATSTNFGAFIEEGKLQVDTAIRNVTNDIAGSLFGGGTGTRGQIASGGYSISGATVTITLSDAGNIGGSVTQFEVNMTLTAGTTDGGAPSTDTVLVTGVDRSNGIVTGTSSTGGALSGNWASLGFLAIQGDVPSAGVVAGTTTSYQKIMGLGGWLPPTITSGDSFWGVNRFQDPQRLGPVTTNGSQQVVEEALIDLSTAICVNGGSPDMCFVNYNSWAALAKEAGAKVQNVMVKHDTVDISFRGFQLMTPNGEVTVIADRSCPQKTAFMLSMENWKLRTLGRAPHILHYGQYDTNDGLRVGNADAVEIRLGLYGNLTCNAPGFSGRCSLSV